ncbi:MAG: hypothetical protein ABIF01_01220 [Candidatus Micrarchaeota archaeon]
MDSLVFVGLAAIAIGWLMQLAAALKGVKEIQTSFVVAYLIGVAALVADGFTSAQLLPAVLNSIVMVVSALVLFQTKAGRKN